MAEIKIEKKPPVWPWIIAALVIIGIILYFVLRDDNGETDTQDRGTTQQTDTVKRTNDRSMQTTPARADGDAVTSYVQYVGDDRGMGLDHAYTSGAFTRLEAAVRAKAMQLDYDVQVDLQQIDDHTSHITDDPYETTHANHIRSAADALSSAMRNMQREHFPNLDQQAQRVETAASSIDQNTLTLDQRDAVKGFFDESANLLRSMQ